MGRSAATVDSAATADTSTDGQAAVGSVATTATGTAGLFGDPVVLGTLMCVVSAVGYTATNIFLRDLATRVDPYWVSCVKAMPTVLIALVMMAVRSCRGLSNHLSWRAVAALVAVAVFAQLFGNVGFQWALSVVGLALAVPMTHGVMMISGAVAGRLWLGEPVTLRAIASMAVLLVAIVVLSTGAGAANAAIVLAEVAELSPLEIAKGIAITCMSGVAYALLGVVIRRVSRGRFPISSMLLVVCTTGVVTLGAATFSTIGWRGILATTAWDWGIMLAAGVLNAVAFFALSKALRLVTVVHVNLVNASQVAMAAVAGVAFFDEAWTAALSIGVGLTVLGLLVMRKR
jgi:DME family drug/metabolite transporter